MKFQIKTLSYKKIKTDTMSYIAQERHLVRHLDPFHIVCHCFEKYAKARPTTEMLVDLWSKEPIEASPGSIQIPPFDEKLDWMRIRTSERDANVVEELVLSFPKPIVSLQTFQERFGQYELSFDEDAMLSSFGFSQFRSIFIDTISCRYTGKFSETETGDFKYIHPETFDRRTITRENLRFKSFALHFRKMGW